MPLPRIDPAIKAIIIDMFLAGVKLHAIAETEQVSVPQIVKTLKEQGINVGRRQGRYSALDKMSEHEVEKLIDDYKDPSVAVSEICVRAGLSMNQFYRILAVLEIPHRAYSTERMETRRAKVETALNMYRVGCTYREIKEETGIDKSILVLELHRAKIPFRVHKHSVPTPVPTD